MLIDARLRYEAQEQRIDWHVRMDPKTGGFKFPHYPPTDHTRAYPRLLKFWCEEQEIRKDIKQGSELEALRLLWKADGKIITPEHYYADGSPAYVFHDADLGADVAVDKFGKYADGIYGELHS